MASIFTRIIQKEIPAYILKEDDRFICFLDVSPSAEGHALVVPKKETDRLFDLETDYLDGLLSFAQPVAHAIQKVTGADRVNILTFGFEVPHAHVHLLPMNSMQDMDNFMHKKQFTPEEFKAIQERILAEME